VEVNLHSADIYNSLVLSHLSTTAGDMEFKQNKFLPAEKQIITANPDVTTVRILPAVFTIQISMAM